MITVQRGGSGVLKLHTLSAGYWSSNRKAPESEHLQKLSVPGN